MKFGIVGLGAIGVEVLRYMLERGHTLVFAVDSDKSKSGMFVNRFVEDAPRIMVRPEPDLESLGDADVAIICTSSKFRSVYPLARLFTSAGIDVVSTCEELAYPWFSEPSLAQELDSIARSKGCTAVGAGVNPGFVMDLVPSIVALASKNVSEIHVTRSVDISRRRSQLRSKLGVGMLKDSVEKGLGEGKLGHVGLQESLHLIAYSMGMQVSDFTYGYKAVIGSDDYVIGVKQYAEGKAGECRIRLDLEMSLTSADFDLVEIEGEPRLKLRFEGGVFGDTATVAMVVSVSERISAARPGLVTVLDIPISKAPQTNAFRSS